MSAQRTRASAAWPATRNGNVLVTRQRSGPRPLQALVTSESKIKHTVEREAESMFRTA